MPYSISILPLGEIDDFVLEYVQHSLENAFNVDVHLLKGRAKPQFAYSDYRHQYSAPSIVRRIAGLAESDNAKILAVTPFDLFAPRTNFVFGEAQIAGPAAVISLYRLLDEDKDKYLKRAGKEAIHEIGHAFGLDHCEEEQCVMRFSHNISDADIKQQTFCRPDRERLNSLLHSND
jgi:archaemetzincin